MNVLKVVSHKKKWKVDMEEVIDITKEKYMDTDMDTILISFSDTKEESFVSEYPVPDEMPYLIMYSKIKESKFPSWIEIVNPQGLLETEKAYIPDDIGKIEYGGNQYTLLELVRKLV